MSYRHSGARSLVDIHLVNQLPGYLAIHAEDMREIVRITAAGDVVVNPDFTIDEAARQFWRAIEKLARKR